LTHFYESVTILTKDGIQFKSYANDHPEDVIIAKPKYVPITHVSSDKMQYRFMFGHCVNRVNFWTDKTELRRYMDEFKKKYPHYIYNSKIHQNWFFCVPKEQIASVYDAKQGLKRLMKMPVESLDKYLKVTVNLINFIKESGVKLSDLGITNSTLLGNYTYGRSDIDLMVYGKENTWKIHEFLKNTGNKSLKWKSIDEWKKYFSTYNNSLNFTEKEFIKHSQRKTGDGFFEDVLFSIFGVEEKNEICLPWNEGKITPLSSVTVKGTVVNNFNSVVRPGIYEINNSKIINGKDVKIKKIITYARDFMMQALEGEEIIANGLLEKVEPENGDEYYRLVVGYSNSYLTERREKEFIKSKIK